MLSELTYIAINKLISIIIIILRSPIVLYFIYLFHYQVNFKLNG